MPWSVNSGQQVRLLAASIPWSVNTPHPPSPLFHLISSDTTAGNRCASMPTASSVVSRLSTSRFTIASCTAFHPLQTSRTVAVASERPKGPWGLLCRLQLL
jgi:hypothetical protein